METGKRVVDGETYPRSVTADVATRVVTVVHVTTCKDGKAYVTTKFDFNGVDDADVLECAARHLVIACRGVEFRTITVDKAIAGDGATLDPSDYIKRERATADPKKRALKAIDKLSEEDAKEIMAILRKKGIK